MDADLKALVEEQNRCELAFLKAQAEFYRFILGRVKRGNRLGGIPRASMLTMVKEAQLASLKALNAVNACLTAGVGIGEG